MPAPFDQANEAAVLAAGTNPRWQSVEVFDTGEAPSTNGIGISTIGAVNGWWGVACRRVPGRRSAKVAISSFDAAGELTVTVDASSVVTASQPYADAGAALDQLAADINADGTLGPKVTATGYTATGEVSDASTVTAYVEIVADSVSDMATFDASISAGTIVADVDAISATFDVYRRLGGQPASAPNRWCLVDGQGGKSVDTRNTSGEVGVSAADELAIVVTALSKNAGDGASVRPRVTVDLGTMGPADI